MTARLTRLATGLTGAILTGLLLAGPPWLLTTFVGPPSPSSWPNLESLRAIATTGVTDTFVITTLAVIVWIAWAQLALAITTETIAAIRRRPAARLPLLPGTQPLAARLVAATLLLITVLQPRPLAAAAPLDLATAATGLIDEQPAAAPEPPVATRTAAQTPTSAVEVGERDSWWSLAETHLDDGLRWRELRDLNAGRTQPDGTTITGATDQLQPGWSLLVPATDTDDGPTSPHEAVPDDAPQGATDTLEDHWNVERGDHFWDIAKTTLEQAWDRIPDDDEVVTYWHQLIDTNRDRLAPPGDPDLIHPGQEFELPPPPPDVRRIDIDQDRNTRPDVEVDERARTRQFEDPGRLPEPSGPPAGDDAQTRLEEGAPSHTHDQRTPDEEARSESEPPAEEQDPAQRDEDEASSADAAASGPTTHQAPSPSSGWEQAVTNGRSPEAAPPEMGAVAEHFTLDVWSTLTAGVAAAGLAGAGITVLVARRRRLALQQRSVGTRLPTPAPDTLDHLHRLELAAPDEHTTLAVLSDLLTTIPSDARPAIVTLSDDGTVRLLFADDTDPGPPAEPWQDTGASDREPTGWTARLGERGPRRSIGLPLLLTLGRADDRTILANLGSIPALAVCGPSDVVADALHAATFEVATSRIAGPLTVAVTGSATHPALDQAQTTDDPAAAFDHARHERDQQIIDDDRTVLLVVAHAGMSMPNLEETTEDPLIGVLRAANAPPAGAWAITVKDHDTATLHLPDGGLVALQRPDLDVDALRSELDRHEQHVPDPDPITAEDPANDTATPGEPDEQLSPDDAVIDLTGHATTPDPMPSPSVNGHPRSGPVAATPSLQVRILGPVEVHRDGEPLTGLAPLTLQILVYLATHRDGVTPERLEDVIWNGQLASPNSQRLRSALTKLRNTLGPDANGEPFLPRRRHRTDPVHLAGPVSTDLDLAIGHLEHARSTTGNDRLVQLDHALDYVRGEPFAGWPLSWASEIAERAIAQLQDAAAAAAAGHRRRGEYEAAEHAIRAGLRLCDPNETLYIEWARLEAGRGRHDQIGRIRQRLQAAYDAHADETGGFVGTITPATTTVFQELQAGATT